VIPHDLELELLPALDRLLDQDLVGGRLREPVADDCAELLDRARRAPARPAEGERGPDDERQTDLAADALRVLKRACPFGARDLRPDLDHCLLEELPVLRHANRVPARADQLDRPLVQDPRVRQGEREVQPRLSADRRKERIRTLPLDDLLQERWGERLDIGRVGELRVGHDRRGIRVDEDHAIALAPERPDGLRAGIVELAGLSDDDRPRSDDENFGDVRSLGHREAARSISGAFGEELGVRFRTELPGVAA
jgi:hypothetical protein